jgi:hypothetical protein
LKTPISLEQNSDTDDEKDKRISKPYTLDTDASSEVEFEKASLYTRESEAPESPNTSAAPSIYSEHDMEEDKLSELPSVLPVTYPPRPLSQADSESVASLASGSSKKARPESMLVLPTTPLVLGIALVDFNHLVSNSNTHK